MPDKQIKRRIRENIRAAIKELWNGWIRPIAVMILGAVTLFVLLDFIGICFRTFT